MSKVFDFIKKNTIIICVVVFMAAVYIYNMFSNKPWYDELYTYYYFISRGPVYAAIHWPVPNNHIGYSVLSAVLDIFGNPYIGLRGVSVICSVCNIILIYKLLSQISKRLYGYMGAFIYSSAYLVHSLAFQGRGYALTTTCFLVALTALYNICTGSDKKVNYFFWGCALALGLYTIPSSLYWVLPVCISGGLLLLIGKEYKKMWKLIVWSLLAAIVTGALYSVVWLAIGSNLLSKNPESIFYGLSHVQIILHAPFKAWMTGIEYMLATPYIQSMDRMTVITGIVGYFNDLFNLYYYRMGYVVIVSLVVGTIYSVGHIIINRPETEKYKPNYYYINMVIAVNSLFLPVMLIIQSVQPYKRVFSYFAIIVAINAVNIISVIVNAVKNKKTAAIIEKTVTALICLLGIIAMFLPSYQTSLAGRENDILQILKQYDGRQIESIYYTDDFQKYVIKFYCDNEPVETTLEEAQYVMVSEDLLSEDGFSDWPMFTHYGDFKIEYVESQFECVALSDKYYLYRRK